MSESMIEPDSAARLFARREALWHLDAKSHGRSVGANMAGAERPYDHLPFFYSDLFDLGYEAIGELDARLDVLADGDEPGVGKNVYYYLDSERRPRGILLWKVFGQVDAARE